MPIRNIPLTTGNYYHTTNKSLDNLTLFPNKWCYKRILKTARYYQFANLPIKLSHLLSSSSEQKEQILGSIITNDQKLVDLIAYCFLPNHFHLILLQKSDEGISTFMSKLQNSYTRYVNSSLERTGSILVGQFKAAQVHADNLTLLSKYIHLSPFLSKTTQSAASSLNYAWSSIKDYTSQEKSGFCNTKPILTRFKSKNDYQSYMLTTKDKNQFDNIQDITLE